MICYWQRVAYKALWGNPHKKPENKNIEDKILEAKSIENKRLEDILEMNPRILLYKVRRVDPQGIVQEGTLYQLLLQVDENHIRNEKGETLVETARRILKTLPNGVEEEKKQYDTWFHGWDEEKHIRELRAEFRKVTEIFDEPAATDDELKAVTEAFGQYLSQIRTPKNCIRVLWDDASFFYNSDKFVNYGGFGDGDGLGSKKNILFCCGPLGLIDRHLPAWGMQVLDSGIFYYYFNIAVARRVDVSHYYSRGSTAGSLLTTSSSLPNSTSTAVHSSSSTAFVLGLNSFMSIFGGNAIASWGPRAELRKKVSDTVAGAATSFSFFCQHAKTSIGQVIDHKPRQRRCLVM